MATVEQDVAREQWDATNYAAKDNLLRVVREEAERFFDMADSDANWELPTAAGHWQVRDIVGHLVDTTEGYLQRFEITRSGGSAEALAGLSDMGTTADERAAAHRETPRSELMARLRKAFDEAMSVFAALTEDEWGSMMVTHGYMGPLPAFFYPIGQLMDYGVHSWDVREGLGKEHFLGADAADLLVPFMFVLWQATCDASRLEGKDLSVGVRVSGRNAGTYRISCGSEGLAYEPGDIDDLATRLEFDPASLVLTAFGRVRGGTAYGDLDEAKRFGNLFFRI